MPQMITVTPGHVLPDGTGFPDSSALKDAVGFRAGTAFRMARAREGMASAMPKRPPKPLSFRAKRDDEQRESSREVEEPAVSFPRMNSCRPAMPKRFVKGHGFSHAETAPHPLSFRAKRDDEQRESSREVEEPAVSFPRMNIRHQEHTPAAECANSHELIGTSETRALPQPALQFNSASPSPPAAP